MNLISNFLSSIIQFIINLMLTLCSLILAPVYGIVKVIFPDISEYMGMVTDFFINTVAPSMAFIRECFFNITGTSRELWTILIGFWLSYFTIAISLRVWNLLVNLYCLIRGIPRAGTNPGGRMVE